MDIKFLKVTQDIYNNKFKYIPINGKKYTICSGLEVQAEMLNNEYIAHCFTFERENPNNSASKTKVIKKTHKLTTSDKKTDLYRVLNWSYLKGCYYSSVDYEISVVSAKQALNSSSDPVIKAQIYFSFEDYKKAHELLDLNIAPDKKNYYFVNKEANELKAIAYENGLGVQRDLNKAYIHYLYAQSFSNVIRFLNMGYGKGVITEDINTLSWHEYYTLKLLYNAGERDYAYYRMVWLAGCWCYSDSQKNSKEEKFLQEHKFNALIRLQACEWIMECKDFEQVKNDNLVMFAGGYFSYLINGHEEACTGENDQGGGCITPIKKPWVAKKYLQEGVQSGNEFALRVWEFIELANG